MNCRRKLGATDIKYKIICAGSGFDIGAGKSVTVSYNGKSYQAKMHSKTKGRIDGLGALYGDANFIEGQELDLLYDGFTNTIKIQSESYQNKTEQSWQTENFELFKIPNMSSMINEVDFEESPEFYGEYYGVGQGYKPKRTIAKYGNTLYFVYHGDVLTCESHKYSEAKILIKDAMGLKKKNKDDSHLQIFVNTYGIFVYNSYCDRGDICKLFNHNGKEKGCFHIDKRGRVSVDNNILPTAYITEDYFYCISKKDYFVYHFGTQIMCHSELENEDMITGMCVDNKKVYVRIEKEYNNTQWYKLRTSEDSLYTTGELIPIFRNLGKYQMFFLDSPKGVAWLEESLQGTNLRAYSEVELKTGKFTGKKCYVNSRISSRNVVYFNGEYMLAMGTDNRDMYKVDLKTGKEIYLTGVFEADKFLVSEKKLYVTRDFGNFEQKIVSIPLDSILEKQKICNRLW